MCFIATVGLYRVDRCIDLFSCAAATVLNKLAYLLRTLNVRLKLESERNTTYQVTVSTLPACFISAKNMHIFRIFNRFFTDKT